MFIVRSDMQNILTIVVAIIIVVALICVWIERINKNKKAKNSFPHKRYRLVESRIDEFEHQYKNALFSGIAIDGKRKLIFDSAFYCYLDDGTQRLYEPELIWNVSIVRELEQKRFIERVNVC